MNRTNLEKYLLSLAPIKSMLEQEIITNLEYQKAESFLAKKYCIKKGNLYRHNLLTKPPKRVIYMMSKEEVYKDGKDDNKTRHITKLGQTH